MELHQGDVQNIVMKKPAIQPAAVGMENPAMIRPHPRLIAASIMGIKVSAKPLVSVIMTKTIYVKIIRLV
jgi:hypothetical protein